VAGGSLALAGLGNTNSGSIELQAGGSLNVNSPLANNGLIHVDGGTFVVNYSPSFFNTGDDLAAAFASVPEPASLAWVLGAAAIGLTTRRRRAHQNDHAS